MNLLFCVHNLNWTAPLTEMQTQTVTEPHRVLQMAADARCCTALLMSALHN